jgi:hypothetical protein
MGGFDDDDDDKPGKPKPGLKINNKNSMFSSLPKKPNPADFQKQVQESQDKIMGYESEAAQLAAMFQKLLEDKTLPDNKNIMSQEAERDLIAKIVDVAVKLNNDENEMEGMGSVGTSILLFRAVLHQKDRISKLEYNLQQAEKKIKSLAEKIDLQPVDSQKSNE